MYGLSQATLQALRDTFAKYPAVEKVILYGSRAMGNYRTGSDIDLTLQGSELSLQTLHKIENELDDLLLPYKLDLSLQQHIQDPALLDHIRRAGKVIMERGPD